MAAITWESKLEASLSRAKDQGRLVLMDFSAAPK